jgi:nitric oxide reductase large subunit
VPTESALRALKFAGQFTFYLGAVISALYAIPIGFIILYQFYSQKQNYFYTYAIIIGIGAMVLALLLDWFKNGIESDEKNNLH